MNTIIREARPDDLPELMTIFDGSLLAVDIALVRHSLHTGNALVATENHRILGAIVLTDPPSHIRHEVTHTGKHVHAIAVRRARRNQGIGRALIRGALHRTPALTADFTEAVKPFYHSLGFNISRINCSRYRGVIQESEL